MRSFLPKREKMVMLLSSLRILSERRISLSVEPLVEMSSTIRTLFLRIVETSCLGFFDEQSGRAERKIVIEHGV